jgi:hypothetical protein
VDRLLCPAHRCIHGDPSFGGEHQIWWICELHQLHCSGTIPRNNTQLPEPTSSFLNTIKIDDRPGEFDFEGPKSGFHSKFHALSHGSIQRILFKMYGPFKYPFIPSLWDLLQLISQIVFIKCCIGLLDQEKFS